MSKLMEKIKKNNSNEYANVLSDSPYFNVKELTTTDIPVLNIALSGDPNGGFPSGFGVFAGPSKHFKTNLGLACVGAYLRAREDAVCIYFDSEFGSPPAYLKNFGVDSDRLFHIPIKNIEQLKQDIIEQLENLDADDDVIIFIDSIGNLASKREVDNALDKKNSADMTRAAQLKSLTRMVTPYLTLKATPLIAINHTYKTMDLFPKDVMSGGQGPLLAANWAFIVGRRQRKEGKDIVGYEFVLKVEKSRFVREGMTFPFAAKFETGVLKYSGLLDLALQTEHVVTAKQGWYTRIIPDPETGEVMEDKNWRKADIETSDEFWTPIFEKTDFIDRIKNAVSFEGAEEKDEIENE